MTPIQKQRITELRGKSKSYAVIAAALNISENTVKSFCRRNNLGSNPSEGCKHCGKPLVHLEHRREKLFCSNTCRTKWWYANAADEDRKAVYHFHCPICGKDFTAYGNAHRKYCSRACYGASRRSSDE